MSRTSFSLQISWYFSFFDLVSNDLMLPTYYQVIFFDCLALLGHYPDEQLCLDAMKENYIGFRQHMSCNSSTTKIPQQINVYRSHMTEVLAMSVTL